MLAQCPVQRKTPRSPSFFITCYSLRRPSEIKKERNKRMRKRHKKEDNLNDIAGKKTPETFNPYYVLQSHPLEGANNELRAVQTTEMPREFIN